MIPTVVTCDIRDLGCGRDAENSFVMPFTDCDDIWIVVVVGTLFVVWIQGITRSAFSHDSGTVPQRVYSYRGLQFASAASPALFIGRSLAAIWHLVSCDCHSRGPCC